MKQLVAQDLYDALGGISDRHVMDALPPSWAGGAPAAPRARRTSSGLVSFFLDNGWVAAVLSAVVAISVIVAIVLAGRGEGPVPPVGGTVESESEPNGEGPSSETTEPESAPLDREKETETETESESVPPPAADARLTTTVACTASASNYVGAHQKDVIVRTYQAPDGVTMTMHDAQTDEEYSSLFFSGEATLFYTPAGEWAVLQYDVEERDGIPYLIFKGGVVKPTGTYTGMESTEEPTWCLSTPANSFAADHASVVARNQIQYVRAREQIDKAMRGWSEILVAASTDPFFAAYGDPTSDSLTSEVMENLWDERPIGDLWDLYMTEQETSPETETTTDTELTDLSMIRVTPPDGSAVSIPGDLQSGTYYDESGLPVELTPSDFTWKDRILSGDVPTVVMPQGAQLEWLYFSEENWILNDSTTLYTYDSETDRRPVRVSGSIEALEPGTYFVRFSMHARGPVGENNLRDIYSYDYTFRLIIDDSTIETEPADPLEPIPEEEYDAPRPDPVLNPLSSTCQIAVSFSDASVKLTQAYIYDGELTVSSGLSDVTDTDYVYSGTGAPIDGNYLRVLSEDPYLPTVCTRDPASFRKVFQGGGWRPTSSSYVIYNADFQRLGALTGDLVDGVYYVVIYANTNRSAPGTHKIGTWTLEGIARYNIPFRLVVGDVDFTPPAYPAEEKLHAPFDGLAVTTNRGTTVIDEGYLYQAALTDESGQTALGVDFPAISYQLARNLAHYDKTITISADTAASVVLAPVKTDADRAVITTYIYDRAYALTDFEITNLPDGTYYVLVDIELEGGSFTVDGQAYTGGTARYQVMLVLCIGASAS